MKIALTFFVGLLILSIQSFGQTDTVFNQTNTQGLKQGFWKKKYPNGKLMYKGEFQNGKPVGQMIRYFKSGSLQAIMNYDKTGDYTHVKIFYEDRDISAEGVYYKMLKDSTWRYYSYYSGALLSEESYVKGHKNGLQKSFYPNGKLSEEFEVQNDIKNGVWRQYYEDGTPKMISKYSFNSVNGKYVFYYPNGITMMAGNFAENKRHGTWTFYTEEGKEKYKVRYDLGVINPQDEEQLLKNDKEFFEKVNENIGKFEEPSIEDFYRDPF